MIGSDRMRTARVAGLATGVALALWPVRASAHLVNTGLGPYYDGISHLALTPEDLLPTIALGLLAGLRGKAFGRRLLFYLPVVWLLGGVAGLLAPIPVGAPVVTAVSFLVFGGLVAADAKLPLGLVTTLAALLGLVHGGLNGAAMAQDGLGVGGLLGIATAVFVVVTLSSAFVTSLRAPWTRIAVRVAGSWIVAIGLLMIGWALRGAG
jgi:hydrogenase/urease accessory protein HupE